MEPSFVSVIPPFIVLILGYVTRKIIWSLLAGVFFAAILANKSIYSGFILGFQVILTNLEIQKIYTDGFWQCWNILIAGFLAMLGVFITLLHHSGAAFAYQKFVKQKLRSKKQAEASTLLLSSCLFIDDYFSSLTVGSVMKSVTDPFKIPRAKLAFLVDSMAAPLAIICPISSWVAATVGFLRDSGFSSDIGPQTLIIGSPYVAYINTLPYIIYSFIVILGSWIIVLFGISFGPMCRYESWAQNTGDLFYKHKPKKQKLSQQTNYLGSIWDFLIPIILLIIFVLSGLLFSGNFFLFGGNNNFIDAFRQASAAHGLFIAGICALGFQLIWFKSRGLVTLRELPKIFIQGVELMMPAICVLILAWSLGDLLRTNLQTGNYLARVFTHNLSFEYLPIMFFLGSLVTSTCIGSAWGTAAVMFPIAVQMYLAIAGIDEPVPMETISGIFPLMGAVLSGAVAGDHISPISDTTIMSSTSTGMNHSDHVDTQIGYAVPFILICALGYLILGFVQNTSWVWVSYVAVLIILISILLILNKKTKIIV